MPKNEYLDRLQVRVVYCPECHAAPGYNCVRPNGKIRISNHQSRVNAAARQLQGQQHHGGRAA